MIKSIVSIILSTLFLFFIAAPTVIALIDDSADVSIFFTVNEEEEKKEKDKNKELFLHYSLGIASDFSLNEKEISSEYFFKNYPKPHLNLIFPPPELHIL